jgi:hypothetical protein
MSLRLQESMACEAHWMLLLNVPLGRDGIVVDASDTMGVLSAKSLSREIAVRAKGSAKRRPVSSAAEIRL